MKSGNRSKPLVPPMMPGQLSPTMASRMTDAIDGLAIYVRRLPPYPLTPTIRRRLMIIADELRRMAT